MSFRAIVREIREFPATAVFCASWIIVFGLMVAARLQDPSPPTLWRVLAVGMGEAHRFGDLTLRDLANGEYWRLATCNFVHYSVLHIGLNLFAFYLLGTLLESWYGSWRLVAIYGVTGIGGNLLSALVRSRIGGNPLLHSGGGSVVIMGLIGLCATAGWRSRKSGDRELTWQMLKALGITGALGVAFPRFIDNWGHAGGAVVGLPLGLAHHRFLAGRDRPSTWGLGVVTALLLIGCGLAQIGANRLDEAARSHDELRQRLAAATNAYRVLQAVELLSRPGGDARQLARLLESQAEIFGGGAARFSYERALALARIAGERELTEPELQAFRDELSVIRRRLRGELNGMLNEFRSRAASQRMHRSAREGDPWLR